MTPLPHILVVEDDLTLAAVMCDILAEAGLITLSCTSAIEACDAMARHQTSLRMLITDIQLGAAMTGVDLAVHVAQQWPGMAICVVSGVHHRRPAPLPPHALFLQKPYTTQELIEIARSACTSPTAPGV